MSSDFTVEYWMKTSSTGPGNNSSQWYGGDGIVDAEVGGVTNDWGTSLTGQYLAFGIGNPDVTIHSTSTVNTGKWVHVAATWKQSSGQMILYINGTQEASIPAARPHDRHLHVLQLAKHKQTSIASMAPLMRCGSGMWCVRKARYRPT